MKKEILEKYKSQNAVSLAALNESTPVLLIFLRHFG